MDPTNFYHLGQIQHQERVQTAEEYRRAEALRSEPSGWQRLIARLRARAVMTDAAPRENAWAYRDTVVTD